LVDIRGGGKMRKKFWRGGGLSAYKSEEKTSGCTKSQNFHETGRLKLDERGKENRFRKKGESRDRNAGNLGAF